MRRRMVLVLSLALSLAACSTTDEVTTTVVSGEFTQDIWVTGPDVESDDFGTWPFVYALHGLGGTGDGLSRTAEELASHGVVVFAPTVRTTEPEYIELDGECAYRYALSVAEEYGADLDQPVTVIGHSFGADMALHGGLAEDDYGPEGDYDDCYSGAPRPDVIVPIAGCWYQYEDASYPFDLSPFSNQDADITMVVGTDDEVCEPWQSRDASKVLVEAGFNATLIELNGGNHANVVFFEIVDGEWQKIDDDPIGSEVVQVILDAIDEAKG